MSTSYGIVILVTGSLEHYAWKYLGESSVVCQEFENRSCFFFLPGRPSQHMTESYQKGLARQMSQDMGCVMTNWWHCCDAVTFQQHSGNISQMADRDAPLWVSKWHLEEEESTSTIPSCSWLSLFGAKTVSLNVLVGKRTPLGGIVILHCPVWWHKPLGGIAFLYFMTMIFSCMRTTTCIILLGDIRPLGWLVFLFNFLFKMWQ